MWRARVYLLNTCPQHSGDTVQADAAKRLLYLACSFDGFALVG